MQHATHVQILDANDGESLGDACCQLMRGIAPDVSNAPLHPCENALLARRSCFSATACDFGPTMISPVESVASADTPRSMPTSASGWVTGFTSSVLICKATNHRPASHETVARFNGPVKRTASRIFTQPITGSLMRLPLVRKVPTSLAGQKLGRASLRLKRG